ncbi:MAG: DUF309 domain-containing protein, partial [Actinomycetota bacterium]|nr:DUF309 domain-containing protein [Actinomycetota bacterium]
ELRKAAPAPERELLRALAQLALGLTHPQRANATGAVTLLRRGCAVVVGYADDPPYELDLRRLARAAGELAGRIEGNGTAGLSDKDLVLRLTR